MRNKIESGNGEEREETGLRDAVKTGQLLKDG
jgi:hypothetical protein